METTLLDRKHDRAFGHLDVDGNGFVEHEDVIRLAARLLSGFGEEPGSGKGQRVLNGFEQFWQALLSACNIDGDRRLSPAEWRAGMSGAFVEDADGFDRDFQPLARAVMDLTDTDGDGLLGFGEFATMQRALHTPEEHIRQAFAKLDTSANGSLSVEELIDAARVFYTGVDEGAVGNWLFGPV